MPYPVGRSQATPGRRRAVRWAFPALALVAAGCTEVGPDFKAPDAAVAKAWIAADAAAVRSDAPDDASWWKVFGDPTLDGLVETAYRQNPSLHQAGVRVLQAQAQLGTAIGNLYPQQQQAFGAVTNEHESKRLPNQSPSADRSYTVAQVGLTASWEIDFWGKFRRAIEFADASVISTIDDYDSALVTLLSNVATTYVNIRTLQERLRIVQANIEVQQQGYNLALARFRNGQTGERDVAQAQSELSSTQSQLPQLQQALEQQRDALSVLLGLPPTELADLVPGSGGIPNAPSKVAAGIPADLLRRRPDVRSAQEQAAAQSALIGATKAELYPAFSLTGTFGFVSSNTHTANPLTGKGQDFSLSDISDWSSRNSSFGPGFTWNLLNYGQITNQVRAQDAVFQQAVLAYQQQVLQAQSEVQDGLSQFVRSGEAVSLSEEGGGGGPALGRSRPDPVSRGPDRLHHGSHGPAAAAAAAGRSRRRPRQCPARPHQYLHGAGRRLADPRRQAPGAQGHQGHHGPAHQLGSAPWSRHGQPRCHEGAVPRVPRPEF